MRAALFSLAEGHAHKEEAHGIVSGTKSEVSNFGQISGHTKHKQYGEYVVHPQCPTPSWVTSQASCAPHPPGDL